jgi:aminopeptidase N
MIGLGLGYWSGLYRSFDGDAANQARIAAIIEQRYAPVLARIGFTETPGEAPTITTLRPNLITALGRVHDPRVAAEANRLFVASQTNPNAIQGGLKRTWLGLIAANADAATWDKIHAMAKSATIATERQNLYSLLASAEDEALAKRALELAITDEPGKTVSAGMIGAVSNRHPELALDFILAHPTEVSKFVDSTSQSRFVARIASGSDNAATIAKLDAYAKANLAPTARKPIDQAMNIIRVRLATQPRIKSEVAAWLQGHSEAAPAASAPAAAPAPTPAEPATPPARGERG